MKILFLGKIASGKSTMLKNLKVNHISTDKIINDYYSYYKFDKNKTKYELETGLTTLSKLENETKSYVINSIKKLLIEDKINIIESSYCSYVKELISLVDYTFEVDEHSKYIGKIEERSNINEKLKTLIVEHQNKNYITNMSFLKTNSENILDNICKCVLDYHMTVDLNYIKSNYNSIGRHWHNYEHIKTILREMELTEVNILATLYHDIVYNKKSTMNEEESVELYKSQCKNKINDSVIDLILSTKDLESETELSTIDRKILKSENLSELIEWEDKIFKEYQCYDLDTYKTERIKFLKSYVKNSEFLINYLTNKKYKVGVYVGSFNPFTVGHLDILNQANEVFDKVIVAVGNNVDKVGIEKCEMNPKISDNFEVVNYEGFIVDNFKGVTLIRGIRNYKDLECEKEIKQHIGKFSQLSVVYFICEPHNEYVSSSYVRGLTDSMRKEYEI